jgi:hypothetical protein
LSLYDYNLVIILSVSDDKKWNEKSNFIFAFIELLK